MNVNIDYTYRNINDIDHLITQYIDFGTIEFILLFIIGCLLYMSIFYIFPSINIYFKALKKEKEAKNKKLVLKQILIQKEIEGAVEKEIEEENNNL